jgi:hypothetical protein
VVQAHSVMTETPTAFLIAGALAALSGVGPWAAVRGGSVLGLAALCRPSTLAGSLLVAAAALLASPGRWAERLGRAGAIGLSVLLVLAPWAIRNVRLWGEPVWTTTHGGYTLYLANNPVYYREVLDGPPGAVWSGENQSRWFAEVNREAAGLPEPEGDRSFARSAWSFIREHPRAFARACLARLGRFWGVAPAGPVYPTGLRVLTAAWTVPFWIAAVLGLAGRSVWRWPGVAAPALIVGLSLVHTVFWTDMRMRAPIVPAMALLAAAARLPGWPRRAAELPPALTPAPTPVTTHSPGRIVERVRRDARIPVVVRDPAIPWSTAPAALTCRTDRPWPTLMLKHWPIRP